jgi:hypothetical protein
MRPAFGRERAGMSWYASGRGNDERQVQECRDTGYMAIYLFKHVYFPMHPSRFSEQGIDRRSRQWAGHRIGLGSAVV